MITLTTLQIAITLVASSGALLISFLTYNLANRTFKANRSMEFENYIYKQKHEAYSSIIYEISNLLNFYYDQWSSFTHEKLEDPDITEKDEDEFDEKLEQLADEADRKVYQLESIMAKSSLSVSNEMVKILSDFIGFCYDEDDGIWDDTPPEEKRVYFRHFLQKIEVEADKIVDVFRKDLKLEELHTSIYHRFNSKSTP